MEYKIIVSLFNRTLSLFKDDELVKTYSVGIGKMLTSTPTAYYKINNKTSHTGGPYGVMWMGLSRPHYGIHGTQAPWTIGQVVSDGCIYMHNQDVLELSKIVPIGTTVIIRHV